MTEGAPCRSAVETVDPSESVTVKLGRGDPIPTLSPAAASSSSMHDAMVSAGRRKARRKNKVFFMVLGAKKHQTSVAEFVLSLQSVAIKIGQENYAEAVKFYHRGGAVVVKLTPRWYKIWANLQTPLACPHFSLCFL